MYGADRLVFGGSNIAAELGISEAVIALTVVAFGTSLPELATSVVAAARKQGDLIIGNAVGSCIFNILCVVGLAGAVAPLSRTADLTDADLWVMLALTATIFPFMWSRRHLSRIEGGTLLAVYLGYIGYLALR
jgi:cation:H+ antiporter